MSWLNLSTNLSSNLSSITGHISNFTREVLTEGTEEIYDQEAELSISKSKIRELEAKLQNQKNEWDRINKLNEDLRDRAESAELQIRAISGEYRIKLEEKENEIKELKQSNNDLQTDTLLSKAGSDLWGESDDADTQLHIIGELRRELADLHADCTYWKDIANSRQSADADIDSLRQEHQQKLNTMQSTYSQKFAKLQKTHKEEISDLQKEKDQLKVDIMALTERIQSSADNLESKVDQNDLDSHFGKTDHLSFIDVQNKESDHEKKYSFHNESEYVECLKDKDEIILSLDDEIRRLANSNDDKDNEIELLKEDISNLKSFVYDQEFEKMDTIYEKQNVTSLMTFDCRSTQTEESVSVSDEVFQELKQVKENLASAKDENLPLVLENNKLLEELNIVRKEVDALNESQRQLSQDKLELANLLQSSELERDAIATERDQIEDSVKELDELRYELVKLQSWTSELVEELEISKEVQDEQTFELESLRHICQLKQEPADEIKSLRKSIKRLGEQYVELCQQYRHVTAQLKEANQRLLKECSLRHEHTKDVRQEIAKIRRKFLTRQESKLADCLDEKEKVEGRLVEMNDEVCKQEDIVTELQLDSDYLSQETAAMVADFGCQVNVNLENIDTIESLRAEKAILERTIEGLERRAGTLEDLFADMHEKKRPSLSKVAGQEVKRKVVCNVSNEHTSLSSDDPDKPSFPDKELRSSPGRERAFSPCSVGSQDGSYFDDDHPRKLWNESDSRVMELEGQIKDLLTRINEYEKYGLEAESKQRDWELEKVAMENVIIDLQKRVRHQEAAHKDLTVYPGMSDGYEDRQSYDIQVQNRGVGTDLSSADLDDLFKLRKRNEELALESDSFRKFFISIEHYLIEVVDMLRTLVDNSVLSSPDFVNRLNSVPSDKHSQTVKRLEKVKYFVELLAEEQDKGNDKLTLKEKLTTACEEKDKLNEELLQLKENVATISEKYSALLLEKEACLNSLDALRKENRELNNSLTDLMSEKEQLECELDKLQFQLDTNETDDSKEIGELKMQLSDLKLERDNLSSIISAREQNLCEQEEKFDSMLEQITEEKDRDLLELQEQQEQIMELYKEKQKEVDIIEHQRKQAVKEEAHLRTEVEQLQERLDRSVLELETRPTQNDLEEERSLVSELECNLRQVESEKMQYLENASKQIEVLEDELFEKDQLIKDLELKLLNLESDVVRKVNEISRKEEKIKELSCHKKVQAVYSVECQTDILGDMKETPSGILCKKNEDNDVPSVEMTITEDNTQERHSRCVIEKVIESTIVEMEAVQMESVDEDQHEIEYAKDADRNQFDTVSNQELAQLRQQVSELSVSFKSKDEMIYKLNTEIDRIMNVLKDKDELLLDLQSADLEDANSETRRRIINYIRELEGASQVLEEKISSQEELIHHFESQLVLMKNDRSNLIEQGVKKDEELNNVMERLENVEARSQAKERASSMLHQEHQRLLELNNSQGEEIAKLREKIRLLQSVLESKQEENHQIVSMQQKHADLEKEINDFQQEEERLLTLLHEKDNRLTFLERSLQEQNASNAAHRDELRSYQEKCLSLEKELDLTKITLKDLQAQRLLLEESKSPPPETISRGVETVSLYEGIEVMDGMASLMSSKLNVIVADKAVSCHIESDSRPTEQQMITELSTVKGKLDEAYQEKALLKLNVSELKQLLDVANSENEKQQTETRGILKEKDTQLEETQRALDDFRNLHKQLEQKYQTKMEKVKEEFEKKTNLLVKDFEYNIGVREEELNDTRKKIELLQSVNEKLKSAGNEESGYQLKFATLQDEMQNINHLCEDRQQQILSLKQELHRTSTIISAGEAALEKTQEDNKQLKVAFEEKVRVINELEQERNALKQRVKELELEIRRLTISYREVEAKAAKDMERLRNHLIEIEETYTTEVVEAQNRETSLMDQLNKSQVEVQLRKNEFIQLSASSQRQLSELQEQLFSIAEHRDQVVLQLAGAQEQVQQHANAMNNLQRALEQFQKDKDTQNDLIAEQSRKDLLKARQEIEQLKEKEKEFQDRISEATLAVQGVANISRQLEVKDNENDKLKEDISNLSHQLRFCEEEIQNLRVTTENKLDKALIKNVMLGYFHTPENKRAEVVHVLGNLLEFSKDEIQQVGTGAPPVRRGWVSSIIPFGLGIGGGSEKHGKETAYVSNKSFSEAFVNFLEQESTSFPKTRPTANKLTSLMLNDPAAASTPLRGSQLWSRPASGLDTPVTGVNSVRVSSSSGSHALLNTIGSSATMQASSQLLYSRPMLFPAPGQEIPKVHTSTANSALQNILSS